MSWTRGYAGSPPKQTVEAKHGNVTIRGTAYAVILNSDDPDVSFAYCYCGSLGSQAAAEASKARGIEKAQFKHIEAIIPEIAKTWAKAFSKFPTKTTLDIFIGEDDHRGLAEPYNGLRFDFDMRGVDARYKNLGLSTGERLSLKHDLFGWYKSAKKRMAQAKKLTKQLAELRVGLYDE